MENQTIPPQMNPPELTPIENKPKFLRYLPYVILPLIGGVVVFAAMNFYKPEEVNVPAPVANNFYKPEEVNVPVPAANQETQTPPATETTQPKAGDLSINWFSEPVKVSPSTIDLSVKDPTWEGVKVDDLYEVYQVGTVTSAPFQNDKFYVITRVCPGPCGSFYYRVIDDRGKQGLVFLSNLSNEIYPSDKVFFVETNQYDVPALRFPEKLSVQYTGKTLNFEAENFSPTAMFKDYIKVGGNWDQSTQRRIARNLKSDIKHPQYGILYEETDKGYFIARLPDGTLKLYRLQFPFSLSDDSKTGFLVQSAKLNLRLANGSNFTANYTPKSVRACPPREYDMQKGIEGKIKKSGTIGSAGDFYELSNSNDPMYNEIYQSFYNPNRISYATFLADHPIIFWKDTLDRWFRLRNSKFYPATETECAYFNSAL